MLGGAVLLHTVTQGPRIRTFCHPQYGFQRNGGVNILGSQKEKKRMQGKILWVSLGSDMNMCKYLQKCVNSRIDGADDEVISNGMGTYNTQQVHIPLGQSYDISKLK